MPSRLQKTKRKDPDPSTLGAAGYYGFTGTWVAGTALCKYFKGGDALFSDIISTFPSGTCGMSLHLK